MFESFLTRVATLAQEDLLCPKCHSPAVIEGPDLWCPHCHYSEPLRDYPEFHYRESPIEPKPVLSEVWLNTDKASKDKLHHIKVELNTLMNRLNTHLDNTKKAQKARIPKLLIKE